MIGVVTDSSCDIPAAYAAELGIGIAPLTIRFGDDSYVDRVELSTDAFWDLLTTSGSLPETAAPSPGTFLDVFAAMGPVDGIVCVCLSSKLSGTYQSAVLAAESADIPVTVIDSGVVSMALGLAAIKARAAAEEGMGLAGVADAAATAAARAQVFAALDTLEFLERGGRIGKVAARIGGMLDVKPIITLEDGAVAAAGRVRTRSKALAAVSDHIASRNVTEAAVLYSGTSDIAPIEQAVSAAIGRPALVAELGPVVGTHTGPGVAGVAYLSST